MEMITDIERPANMTGVSQDAEDPSSQGLFHLDLWIHDLEVIHTLVALPEGRRREEFTIAALKIGVVALQQAQGRIDADAVRNEGNRLIAEIEGKLASYQGQMTSQVSTTLREYFDPTSGRFNERVERLVKQDGELETVLRARMDQSIVALNAALETYVGEDSQLMELLSPSESNALIASIKCSVDQLVAAQQAKLLSEFSLDNKSSALARLVAEVSAQNGNLTEKLQGSIQEVVREFSLDSEDSALSRLVKRVEAAQRQISSEFSLDSEQSALSRMKRDLTGMIDGLKKDSNDFQQKVVAALEAMRARKQESLVSTTHGKDFEQAVYAFIEDACQLAGDIPERTGDRTGLIRNCKKGDCVVTMGPDADAAGARIVLEMKEDASYDLAGSLSELREARENREATVGLFVHSKRTAPAGLRRLARYGNDVVIIWDADDAASDVFLSAAVMVCKALALRKAAMSEDLAADFEALDKAIREIERQVGCLDEIDTSSQTIKNGAEKILKRVEIMRTALNRQIEKLDEQSQALHLLVGDTHAA